MEDIGIDSGGGGDTVDARRLRPQETLHTTQLKSNFLNLHYQRGYRRSYFDEPTSKDL